MWGKIIIPMYRIWLNGLYGLYGPRCPLFSKRPINLISLSLSLFVGHTNVRRINGYQWSNHLLGCNETTMYNSYPASMSLITHSGHWFREMCPWGRFTMAVPWFISSNQISEAPNYTETKSPTSTFSSRFLVCHTYCLYISYFEIIQQQQQQQQQ